MNARLVFMGPHAFARLLVVILPTSLLLTYIFKLASSDSLRRDAIAELYAASDEAAALAPTVVHHYIGGGGTSTPRCSDAERAALFRAGAQLGGSADWMVRAGWGEAADCCEWKGVSCAGGRGVESISLSKERLQGTLPTELGALAHLTSLDVNENAGLSGTLPTELAAAPKLTHLYAFGAHLSGTLPLALGGAHALQELELSHCRISGTLPGALPASLRFIFLESNRISGVVPSSLGQLRRLRELELSHNRLSGSLPGRVAHLRMDHLDFGQNPKLTGVPVAAPKQGCSGGGDRYLRGAGPGGARVDAAAHAGAPRGAQQTLTREVGSVSTQPRSML